MSSYGWSSEDQDGWPPRHYYTYYTTLGQRQDHTICMETLILIIIMICSLVANVTIIIFILRRKDMQTVTNCFIGNLACADLIFVLSIPIIVAARASSSWNLGETTCKLLSYSQFVCGSVLLWTLTAISVDRVRCLTNAPYRSGLTLRTAVILSGIAWIVALIIYIPVAVFFREQHVQYNETIFDKATNVERLQLINATICTLVFPTTNSFNTSLVFTIIIAISSSLIPMIIIIYNCHKIFKKLAQMQRKLEEKLGILNINSTKMRNSIQTIAGSIFPSLSPQNNLDATNSRQLSRQLSVASYHRLKKHKRAVRILIANVCAVLIMWLPISIVMFLIYEDGHRKDDKFFLTNHHFLWSVIIALTNTIVNPFLYGFLTENFKEYFPLNKWFKSHCCCTWMESKTSDIQFVSSSQNSRNMSYLNIGMENADMHT